MSKKLEEDYQNFDNKVEQKTEEAIKKIRDEANKIEQEAAKIGQAFEDSIKETKERKEKG